MKCRSAVSALLFVALILLFGFTVPGRILAAPESQCNPTTGAQLKTDIVSGTCFQIVLAATVYHTNNIAISRDLEIDGAGQSLSVIDAGAQPLFQVYPNHTISFKKFTLRNAFSNSSSGAAIANTRGTVNVNAVTFWDDRTSGAPGLDGGAIESSGTLTVTNSSFVGDTAFVGGAIAMFDGALTVRKSHFTRNQAVGGNAGAIYFSSYTGDLTIDHSTFGSNAASNYAGAIYLNDNNLTISASHFTGNIATNGAGGALYLYSCATCVSKIVQSSFVGNQATANYGGAIDQELSHLTIRDSTFSYNAQHGTFAGGALSLLANDANIINTTFDHNHSDVAGGAIFTIIPTNVANSTFAFNQVSGIPFSGFGGGIFSGTSTTTLLNVTMVGNQAWDGGNVQGDSGTMYLKNTILAQGSSPNCGDGDHYQSQGSNISSDSSCGTWLTMPGDRNSIGVKLGPLANNGGPTKTFLPESGSPAINGVVSGCPPPSTDQRGDLRPQGSHCDVGSVEAP